MLRRLLLMLRERSHRGRPGPRRLHPLLALGRQLIALLQDADAHRVGWLGAFSDGGRVDRRATLGTERLKPRLTAVGVCLHVAGRLTSHLERATRNRN